MSEPSVSDRDHIEQLADSFMTSFRAGQRPSIDAYVAQYPDLADQLRDLIKALVLLERNAPQRERNDMFRHLTQVPPVEIGEFTIVREIGRGGMGVVYEAVQQSLGRHVALKVLSIGSLLHPTHLERFRLEARSAGRLHHSHIVPVFGVGESDGLHYYAMQYIPGQSLDQVIEALRAMRIAEANNDPALPVDKRTESSAAVPSSDPLVGDEPLASHAVDSSMIDNSWAIHSDASSSSSAPGEFSKGSSGRAFYESVARVGLQVAEALAYAHSEGILHRDIKPSNLLLDAKGNAWVTDFGLVKTEETNSLTDTGDFVGTLRYTAPERLDGWSDRRSDLYSLGTTLYELMTLCTFFDSANRAQLVEYIREKEPLRPAKIDPTIPRDLETIVLKALAKEPSSRYRTADEMAEDLRCFLADRPIQARRSTRTEQLTRWCRRNPAIASLAAAVAVALIAGTIASSWQAVRATRAERLAERRLSTEVEARAAEAEQRTLAEAKQTEAEANFQQAKAAVAKYFTLVSENTLFDVPGLEPLRRDLMENAIEFYEVAALQRTNDPEVLVDVASIHLRMGSIHMGLNEVGRSLDSVRRALDILDRLHREHPSACHLESKLAGFWKERRWTQSQVDAPRDVMGAMQTMLRLEHTWTALARRYPSEPGFRMDLANLYAMIGEVLWIKELVKHHPWEPGFPMDLGYAQKMIRDEIWSIGAADEATAYFERNRHLTETLLQEYPNVPSYRANAAVGSDTYAVFLITIGRHDQALPIVRRMVEISNDLVAEFPEVPAYRAVLAQGLTMLGALTAKSEPDAADKSLRRAVKLAYGLAQEFPSHLLFIQAWGRAVAALATLQVAKAPGEAGAAVNQVVDALEARLRERPYDHALRCQFAEFCHQTGREFLMRGSSLAVPLELRAKALFSELAEEFPGEVHYREHAGRADLNLGIMARQAGQYDAARKHFEEAVDAFARIAGDKGVPSREGWYRSFHDDALIQVATACEALGEIQEAVDAARRSVDVSEPLVRQFPDRQEYRNRLARATRLLSQQLLAGGQPQDAIAACRRQITFTREMERLSPGSSKRHLPSAHLALALVLIRAGAMQEAKQEWETTIRDDTLDNRTLVDFVWDLVTPRDVEPSVAAMAVEVALHANKRAPQDALTLNTLGVAQYRAGNWGEAIASFVKAEASSPDTSLASSGFFRAMAHWRLEHPEEARHWFDRSRDWMEQYQPGNPELNAFRIEAEQLLGDAPASSETASKEDSGGRQE